MHSIQTPANESVALAWYGLRARPYSLAAQPKGSVVYVSPESVASDPRLAELITHHDPVSFRHGALAYPAPLDTGLVKGYELVDLSVSGWDAPGLASRLVELKALLVTLLDAGWDPEDLFNDVLMPQGVAIDSNPFYNESLSKLRVDLLMKACKAAGHNGAPRPMFFKMMADLRSELTSAD